MIDVARAHITLLFGLASATTSNSAGNMARAYVGTLRLNVSDNSYAAADSVLPFFKFMSTPHRHRAQAREVRPEARAAKGGRRAQYAEGDGAARGALAVRDVGGM